MIQNPMAISTFAILGALLNIWRTVGIRKKWKDRMIFALMAGVAFVALVLFLNTIGS